MDVLDVSNVSSNGSVQDNCPSFPVNVPEDIDLAAPSWSDCMFTGTTDNILEASDIFSTSLPSWGELSSPSCNSSFSSSALSASSSSSSPPPPASSILYAVTNPASPEKETCHVGLTADVSCAPEFPACNVEGTACVKSEQMDEHFDCPVSEELHTQCNPSLFTAFEKNFDCGDLPVCQLPQEAHTEHLATLDNVKHSALQNAFPGLNCQDQQNMGAQQSKISSKSSISFLTPELPGTLEQDNSENLQVFAQWLKSNADSFSVMDLKKIKLKTSTIENAARQLGGGKKGMAYLLKLVLIWVQNYHLPQKRNENCVVDRGTGSLDSRLLNDVLCSTSVEGNVITGDNLILPVLLKDSWKEDIFLNSVQSQDRCFGTFLEDSCGSFSNSVISQHLNKANMGPDLNSSVDREMPASSIYTSTPSYSVNPTKFRWASDGNSDNLGSFNMRQSQGSIHPATTQPSLGLDHVALSPNVFLPSQPLNVGELWPASMNPNDPFRTTLHERDLQHFTGTRFTAERSFMTLSDSLDPMPSTAAATTRAARKSRMARQKWSVRHARLWPSSVSTHVALSSQVSGAIFQDGPCNSQTCHMLTTPAGQTWQDMKLGRNMRLLLQKELKQSDVGNLGRIVLPKKEAETNLPYLTSRDGVNLAVQDWSHSRVWNMRYRFWPNNKSRMYLLENTAGDFIRSHHLKEGDYMMLYDDRTNGKYMIQGVQVQRLDTSSIVTTNSSSCSSQSNMNGALEGPQNRTEVGSMVGVVRSGGTTYFLNHIKSPSN